MVSQLSVCVCLLVCLSVLVGGDNDCRATFCFKLWSRNINIDLNLFEDAEPAPIEDYIRQHGYTVEAHQITTDDGYILTYHRIPRGKSAATGGGGGKPVLLQHGLLGASSVWVLSTNALAYTLADAGFDVWLGNARGNTYSRKHVNLDPDLDKANFWDFSWHEMGYYDLPASIDYILNVTKQRDLFYIGHSMGTTMFFVLGATRPEYMAKVRATVLMAPVAYPYNIRSPIANLAIDIEPSLGRILKALDVYEIFPYSNGFYFMNKEICSRELLQFLCRDFIFEIVGFDSRELNATILPIALDYLPAGAALKQLQHYSQTTKKGANFPQFDYGTFGNLLKYNSLTPPSYNLTTVNTQTFIYFANNDWLAVPEDVFYTIQRLPNVQGVTEVPNDKFNHLDFMWASDGKTLIYNAIIDTLKNLT